MKKILIYYNFMVVTLVVLSSVFNAQNPVQLLDAIPLIPLVIYFGIFILPRKRQAIILPQKASLNKVPSAKPPEIVVNEKNKVSKEPTVDGEILEKKEEGFDINRRLFLKLIGSAGLSVFFFALFTKKAEATFFGSSPGPGTLTLKNIAGEKINPSEKQPTDGYQISRVDDSTPAYYGFINKDGNWFIMKEGTDGTYLYTKGSSDFAGNWDLKDTELEYDYFDVVF
jgi:hypothetical protein